MARWITVTKAPFDHKFAGRQAYMHFTENGEFYVKDEVADDIVARKLGAEGKASEKPVRKRKSATPKPKAVKPVSDATDTGPADGVDRADLAAADSADSEPPVDAAG